MGPYPSFTYKTYVREHQLDSFGHLNNAAYLTLLEEARWDLVTKRGYGIKTVQAKKKGPIILEVLVKFKKELRGREDICIHTQLESYEGKIGKLRQWITNQEDQICCDAHFVFSLFDMESRRIIEPTPEWRRAVGQDPLPEED